MARFIDIKPKDLLIKKGSEGTEFEGVVIATPDWSRPAFREMNPIIYEPGILYYKRLPCGTGSFQMLSRRDFKPENLDYVCLQEDDIALSNRLLEHAKTKLSSVYKDGPSTRLGLEYKPVEKIMDTIERLLTR